VLRGHSIDAKPFAEQLQENLIEMPKVRAFQKKSGVKSPSRPRQSL
jgi:hypothetical protein